MEVMLLERCAHFRQSRSRPRRSPLSTLGASHPPRPRLPGRRAPRSDLWCVTTHLSPLSCLEERDPKVTRMVAIDEFLKHNEPLPRPLTRRPPAARRQKGRVRRLHGRAAESVSDPRLSIGDAHVIRNAGGMIAVDEIRSLAISQHLLGSEVGALSITPTTGCSPSAARSSSGGPGRRPADARSGAHGDFPTWKLMFRGSIQRIKEAPHPKEGCGAGFHLRREAGRLSEVT